MKKAILGMLVVALGFGTISANTNSNHVATNSVNVVYGPTYTAPWLGDCCESPLTAIMRDIALRGYDTSNVSYSLISVTANTVTYRINN